MIGRRRARPAPDVTVDMAVQVGPVALPNPVVTASGTYGHGDEVAKLADVSAIGAVTAKSLSADPWAGKPAPRLHMTASGMINAVGLQGPGVEAWVRDDLPALRAAGARVIVSIWGTAVEDYARAATMLRDSGSARDELLALEVNVSCPNHHSRNAIFAHDPGATREVLRAVLDVQPGLPVFAKLSPNVTDLVAIAEAAVDAGVDGLTLVNTLMGLLIDVETRQPALGGGGGGLSGPAIKPVALRAVHDVSRSLPGVPIIGTGGVASGVDAVEMMMAGAHAVGVGTVNFLDPRAPQRIARELGEWCAAHGVTRVSELTGSMHD